MPDHTGPYEYLTPYSKIPMPSPPPLPPRDGGNKGPGRGDVLVNRPTPDIPKDNHSTPDNNDTSKIEGQDTKAPGPTPDRRQTNANTYTPTPGGSVVYQPITKRDMSVRQITKVADIPTNIRPLSVNDLSQCLTLIKIDEKIVKVFKDKAIDGELFCNLQYEQLASLDITSFDVGKLILFRDKNWRPDLGEP